MRLRELLLTLHFFAGVLAAIFLLLLGVSGSLVAFENEIDRALNPSLTWVKPGTQRLSLTEMKARLETANPGFTVMGFSVAEADNMAWGTFLVSPAQHKSMGLAFNPYTGVVLGDESRRNEFTGTVHQFHLRLLLGSAGATIVSWAAVFLLFLAVSGLVLWWPRKIFWPNWRRPWKLVNWELHQAVGIYMSVFLMIFSLTAIVIHWEDPSTKLLDRMTGSAELPPIPEPPPAPAGATPLDPERLLGLAEAAVPGARPTFIQLENPVRVALKYPEDRTPAGRSNVFLDSFSGRILYVVDARKAPIPYRYVKLWNREIHTGDIGGLPTRILACILSLMLPVLAITGPLIWLTKSRNQEGGAGPSD